ncbi:peroxiredoxin family protein [Flavobacterium sp.]|uniref:peroxiredoxin family protein n=1 Tax=Flavobacterium sp. TaxID=239 RepID=UPI004047E8F7
MKKYLKIILPLLVLSLTGFMGYIVVSKIKHKKEIATKIKKIPNFSYNTLNDGAFTLNNLITNKAVIFIYFNSDCNFCNHEAEMIQQNIDKLNNIQIVFVSFEDDEKIVAFANSYNLLGYDNIHFLRDTAHSFTSTFDVNSLPSLVLYDKNHMLIEKIKGQVKIEALIEKLKIKN